MIDFLRHSVLIGLGAMSLTKEKADRWVEDLVKRGEMSRGEARQFLDDLLSKGQQTHDHLVNLVREEVERWRKEKVLATKADVERLEAEIKELKAMIMGKESTVQQAADEGNQTRGGQV